MKAGFISSPDDPGSSVVERLTKLEKAVFKLDRFFVNHCHHEKSGEVLFYTGAIDEEDKPLGNKLEAVGSTTIPGDVQGY